MEHLTTIDFVTFGNELDPGPEEEGVGLEYIVQNVFIENREALFLR